LRFGGCELYVDVDAMADATEFPLPPGVADAVLNRAQLARALNKSEPTIDRYIADKMPCLTEGTNGRAWEFQLSDCWTWLKRRERDEAARTSQAEEAVQQMRLALIGGNDVDDEVRSLSPRQRKEAYDAEHAFMMAALARGDLVRRADVVDAFEQVFKTLRDAFTVLPDKGLDVAIRHCDAALTEAERRVAQLAGNDTMKAAAE
jgi:phage terminase Nu1 subunit (DNA packaging protein)